MLRNKDVKEKIWQQQNIWTFTDGRLTHIYMHKHIPNRTQHMIKNQRKYSKVMRIYLHKTI